MKVTVSNKVPEEMTNSRILSASYGITKEHLSVNPHKSIKNNLDHKKLMNRGKRDSIYDIEPSSKDDVRSKMLR